jgi:putative hydrolase of HD superfamily
LPDPLSEKLKLAWLEFETGDSSEARFARSLDRFQPLLINFYSGGGTWKHPQVNHERVLAKKAVIAEGSTKLWEHAKALLDEAVARGILPAAAPDHEAMEVRKPLPE